MTRDEARTVLAVHPGAELFGSDRMFLESVIGLCERGTRVVAVLHSAGPLVAPLRAAGAEVVVAPMLVLRKAFLTPRGLAQLARDGVRNILAVNRLIRRYRPAALYVSTAVVPVWPIWGRLRGLQVISHLHEAEASAGTVMKRLLYAPHRAAHRVVVNSRFTRDTVTSSAGALGSRAVVIYNGVRGPTTAPRAPRTTLEGDLRVLYIGRLSPRKGAATVIEALHVARQAGRPTRLRIVGSVYPGYEWFEAQLRARVIELDLQQHVEFAGFDADIWPQLADADVLVVPSLGDESFGNTAVEGLLARRPVIVSDTSGLREAAGGYPSSQLITAGDPVALAAAFETVRTDWARFCQDVERSAADAEQRNGIAAYRAAVATVVLGAARV